MEWYNRELFYIIDDEGGLDYPIKVYDSDINNHIKDIVNDVRAGGSGYYCHVIAETNRPDVRVALELQRKEDMTKVNYIRCKINGGVNTPVLYLEFDDELGYAYYNGHIYRASSSNITIRLRTINFNESIRSLLIFSRIKLERI